MGPVLNIYLLHNFRKTAITQYMYNMPLGQSFCESRDTLIIVIKNVCTAERALQRLLMVCTYEVAICVNLCSCCGLNLSLV